MDKVKSNNENAQVLENEKIPSLFDIDELKTKSYSHIGDAKITSSAHAIINYDSESMIWQDSPSSSLMLPNTIKWIFIIFAWFFVLLTLRPSVENISPVDSTPVVKKQPNEKELKALAKKESIDSKKKEKADSTENKSSSEKKPPSTDAAYTWTLYIGLIVIAYKLYKHIVWYLQIKNTSYKMSSQRISIESGIFSKSINAYELHQLRDGQIYKPWNLRLFGRDNLYISGLWLLGIKNAEAVRDLIRNAGQIEASRIEKARYR